MIADGYGAVQKLPCEQRKNIQRFAVGVPNRRVEHLIEVAVINHSVPTDAYEVAAHHLVEGRSIETAFQKLHVFFVLAAQLEMRLVAGNGCVGKAIEMIELNTKFFP